MARVKISFVRGLREFVPGANQLAIVAAIDAVAEQRPQFFRDSAFEFDGEIGNAAPRIDLIRRDDGAGRADIDTGLACAAVVFGRRIDGQIQVGINLAQKKPRAMLALQQQSM
jgi:hypothetical protein